MNNAKRTIVIWKIANWDKWSFIFPLLLTAVLAYFLINAEDAIFFKSDPDGTLRSLFLMLEILLYCLLVFLLVWILEDASNVDDPVCKEPPIRHHVEEELQKSERTFIFFHKTPEIKWWKWGIYVLLTIVFLLPNEPWPLLRFGIEDSELWQWIQPKYLIGLMILLTISRFFQYFLQDLLPEALQFFRYLYPSILSILFLIYVIATQEQFGSFFIELMDSPGNLILFSWLFFASLAIVWFAPSYLLFTDTYFEDQEKQRDKNLAKKPLHPIIEGFQLLPQAIGWLLSNLFGDHRRKQEIRKLPKLIWQHKTYVNAKFAHPEPKSFVFFRVLLGIGYIATLAALAAQVYLRSIDLDSMIWVERIALITFLLPAIAIYQHFHPKRKTACSNIKTWWWGYIAAFIVLIGGVIFFSFLLGNKSSADRLLDLLLFFVCTTVLSSLAFVKVAYLYPSTNEKDLTMELRGFVSFILAINCWIAFIAALLFLVLLIAPFAWTYPFIMELNAINIYLLLINGLIAFITIIDRYLKIRYVMNLEMRMGPAHARKTNLGSNQKRPAIQVWAGVFITLAVAATFDKAGSNYHQVTYINDQTNDHISDANTISLAEYTTKFMTRLENKDKECRKKKPIICIAADGGGLKAAFWTMLVLQQLDRQGLFDNNVFMMSGASGGGLGQGLFSYLKAMEISLEDREEIIRELGDANFISGDLAGLLTRWPMSYLPEGLAGVEERQDRMEAMSEHYFKCIQKIGNIDPKDRYSELRKKPYHYLWTDNKYRIPLFITNTSRAEDGVKGWIHPLHNNEFLTAGVVDVTRCQYEGQNTRYISFPDALFLINRFPILSPAARVPGKGHFIDAGAVDNSGMGTILQVLGKMKAKNDTIYDRFFEQGLIIISIRHDRSRFIYDEFADIVEKHLGQTQPRSELSSFFGAVVSSGISGEPKVMDEIVQDGEAKDLFNILDSPIKFSLPFRLTAENVEKFFQRDINNKILKRVSNHVDTINQHIENVHIDHSYTVEPPLGRLLSRPAQNYSRNMLKYKDNKEHFERLKQFFCSSK